MYPENRFVTHIIIMSMSLSVTVGSRPYVDVESNVVSIMFCVVDILGAISAEPKLKINGNFNFTNNKLNMFIFACTSLALPLIIYWLSNYSLTEKPLQKTVCIHLFFFGLPMLLASISSVSPSFTLYINFQIIFVVALLIALVVVVGLALKATGDRIRVLNDAMLHGTDYRSIWKAYTTCEVIFLFPILVIVFFASFIAKVLGCCLQKKKKQNKLTTVSPSNARNNSREMNVITYNSNEQSVFI